MVVVWWKTRLRHVGCRAGYGYTAASHNHKEHAPMKCFLAKLSARPIVTTFAFASVALTLAAAATTPSFHLADLWFNPYAVISAVTVVANLGLWIYYVSK